MIEKKPARRSKYSSRRKAIESAAPEEVESVWNFWVKTHREGSENRVKLTDERRDRIAWAVAEYGVDSCLEAILGCKLSPFHQGDNDRRRKYDDVELILRDAAKIERFCEIARENRSRPKGTEF